MFQYDRLLALRHNICAVLLYDYANYHIIVDYVNHYIVLLFDAVCARSFRQRRPKGEDYGQFSEFHVCFCGLDSVNLKFETVRTNKQYICF